MSRKLHFSTNIMRVNNYRYFLFYQFKKKKQTKWIELHCFSYTFRQRIQYFVCFRVTLNLVFVCVCVFCDSNGSGVFNAKTKRFYATPHILSLVVSFILCLLTILKSLIPTLKFNNYAIKFAFIFFVV